MSANTQKRLKITAAALAQGEAQVPQKDLAPSLWGLQLRGLALAVALSPRAKVPVAQGPLHLGAGPHSKALLLLHLHRVLCVTAGHY
jgi:hypothetical protein